MTNERALKSEMVIPEMYSATRQLKMSDFKKHTKIKSIWNI